jgi:NADP-dependent 3-hydroxy acid dehydrogenase YdfG
VTVELKDKVAVITGAGSGIGRAIAVALAKKKVRLCLLGRDPKKLQEVAAVTRHYSPVAQCYAFDLTNDESVHAFGEQVRSDLKRVDIVVHSAGVIHLGAPSKSAIDGFDQQFRTNVRAPLMLTQVLLPMIKPQSGQIVFINSSAAANPGIQNGLYAATKSALKTMADSLRQELNSKGFRVLSIYPGRTAGAMQEMVFRFEKVKYSPEHLIQPDDVASVVIYALSLPWTIELTDIYARPFKQLR